MRKQYLKHTLVSVLLKIGLARHSSSNGLKSKNVLKSYLSTVLDLSNFYVTSPRLTTIPFSSSSSSNELFDVVFKHPFILFLIKSFHYLKPVIEMKTVLHVIVWHENNNIEGVSVIFKPKDSRNKKKTAE